MGGRGAPAAYVAAARVRPACPVAAARGRTAAYVAAARVAGRGAAARAAVGGGGRGALPWVDARTAPVVDARRRRERRPSPGPTSRREFRRRGAQLPGRPQGEAHISTERPQAGQEARVPPPHVDQGGPGHPVLPPAQGPSQPHSLIWAIRDRATFEALRRSGRRVRRGPITVTWLAGDPAEPPRVAYAIGRRAGGAVVRNRIRRRLRAITREVGAQLRPGAYLVGATAAAASLSYDDLRATVCQAIGALHRT